VKNKIFFSKISFYNVDAFGILSTGQHELY